MTPVIRILTGAVAAIGLALLAVLVAVAPAGAHEGEGVVTVESSTPDGTSVHYVVRLTWANDGHAALDATLTASLYPLDDTVGPPVQLTPVDQDGRYEGTVTFPDAGDYTVRFTGVRPAVTFDQAQNVPTPTTTAAPATTTTTEQDSASTTEPAAGDSDETAAADQTDDGGFPWLPVSAGVVVVAGAAAAAVLVRRRRA